MVRSINIALLLLFLQPLLHAQEQSDSLGTGSSVLIVEDEGPEKTPLGAVLRSAVIPGWGQFYNESYWKVPIVLGLSGFFIYNIIDQHQLFTEYSDLYESTITEENPSGELQWKRFREFYRDNRDEYAWWLFVVYLLQLADAYVDAALFDFDVSEEASATITPAPRGVSLQLRF